MFSSHVPESVPFVENWVDSTKIEQQKVHVLEGVPRGSQYQPAVLQFLGALVF